MTTETTRFDVLSRDLNVFAPHFLEASAGTGKTFAIEHLVTRLLIEGKAPLSIDQALVVTFTRAATRELKVRIRRCLWRTQEELATQNPTVDYLRAICEMGELAIKEAMARIDAALICYDTAQVYTLHGFCHRVLKEFAFEAGIGFEVSDPEEKEHLALLEESVKEYLKVQVAFPDYSASQMQAVLNKYRGDFRKLISKLVEFISNGKEISKGPNFQELHEVFLKELGLMPSIDASLFKEDIERLRPLYKEMTSDEIPSQVQLLAEILESKQCTHQQFDRLLRGNFFLEKMHAQNVKTRAKMPQSHELHYPHLIEKLYGRLVPLIEEGKDPSQIFLRLARDSQEKCQNLLESLEKFSPDALLLKVEQALQYPRFVASVRQKYRAAIIDEFQDTDPVQWTIFQQLFLESTQAICLVGDPKQSIYSFRNADVYIYLSAAEAMGISSRKHLDTNFRSTPQLVKALNRLFSRAQGGWMALPERGKPLDVYPVKSGTQETNDTVAPIQFLITAGKKGRAKKFPTPEMFEKALFPFIASEILASPVEYHDIAILVKDRFQAEEVVAYLKEKGIPASSKRGVAITESIAYFALKELVRAVCSPNDVSKMKAALGGPLIQWNASQLAQGFDAPSLLMAKAQMQALNYTLLEKGFGPFFYDFLATCWGEKSLLEEMMQRGDVTLYLHLRKLSEVLIEEETAHGVRGEAFIKLLDKIAIESSQESSRLKIPSQEEKGSVTVMTIHMSKGLEFDTVFAIGLASRHKISEEITVKKEVRVFDAQDPVCQLAIEEQDAEKMRQLYVALTRAKKKLYIPLVIDEEEKPIDYGAASPIELFFARMIQVPSSHSELYTIAQHLNLKVVQETLDSLPSEISYCILENREVKGVAAVPSDVALIPPDALNLPHHDQQLFSFTALAKKDHPKEAINLPEVDFSSPHTLPLGSQTGHILHLILEKIFKRGIHDLLDENALSILIDEEIASTGLEKWQPILLPWIAELLKKRITTFALADIPMGQFQQEMEFFFPVPGGMMKGFADLFFVFEGKYYLLDWKSNYLGLSDADYSEENILQVMRQNDYFLQASIYAAALERYVKLFDNRPFSECFGGAIYYFIRGKAAYHFLPEPKVPL